MTNPTPTPPDPHSPVRTVRRGPSASHQCTAECYTEAHWNRVKAERKRAQAIAGSPTIHYNNHFDYTNNHFNYPHYNIVTPGSICADHGCRTVHPGIDHAAYVRQQRRVDL